MSGDFDYQEVVFGETWDLQVEDRDLGRLRLVRALQALETHRSARSGEILEAGCGVGRFTTHLGAHLRDAHVVAFDLSQAAVIKAAEGGSGVNYTIADALALPYVDCAFDAVVFFDLLEHLARPAAALAEFARVMRGDGLLHAYVPCEGQPATLHWLGKRWVYPWTQRHAGHAQHFRHAELVRLTQEAGFEVTDLKYSYHLLGQALDVVTFAAREWVFRRRGGDEERPRAYYDRSVLRGSWLRQVYGAVRRMTEAATYAEARLLARCPWALGVHLTARRVSNH
jgi:SAM-dependent methyltransferase